MFFKMAHDSAFLPPSKASAIQGCITRSVTVTAGQLHCEHAREGGQVGRSLCLPIFYRALQLGCGFPNDGVLKMYSRRIVGFCIVSEHGWIQIQKRQAGGRSGFKPLSIATAGRDERELLRKIPNLGRRKSIN